MDNCVLCKIINGELPSQKVYEDENILAILDIFPRSNGHTLVIPKRHCANYSELTDKEASQIAITGKNILNAIYKTNLLSHGANLLINESEFAGQEIMHVHLHIIPRHKGDGVLHQIGKPLSDKDKEDLTFVCKQISEQLN